MTWGNWYWPTWLAFNLFSLMGPETYALITNWKNTFSDWVWNALGVTTATGFSTGSAAWYLTLGGWITVMSWLTWHFWFRKFT